VRPLSAFGLPALLQPFRAATSAALLLFAACAPKALAPPPTTATTTPLPSTAVRAADLPASPTTFTVPADSAAALAAFRKSCPSLQKRADRSGLTQPGDWAGACAAAAQASDPQAFFRDNFRAVAISGGEGFATGYYEPEIVGSRSPAPGYSTPLYKRPPDLVEADLGLFTSDLDGRKLRGRVIDNAFVPYPDRAAIMAGALAGKGLELAWAADPYEAFFLEIQGSGRLRLPDGSIMRIGYASQNGRRYVAIGKVLIDQGRLPKGGANMDAILGWLRSHPAEAPAILAANPSVVFFRELTGDGPIGAMGVAVTPNVSVAADPAFIPLGAPLLVETTLPGGAPLNALMVAQDTGGAIKGPNRIDLFRGSGDKARA
jgi:membrane-bound lytic murein transglycosylase A